MLLDYLLYTERVWLRPSGEIIDSLSFSGIVPNMSEYSLLGRHIEVQVIYTCAVVHGDTLSLSRSYQSNETSYILAY
jgi:hypothetical protein